MLLNIFLFGIIFLTGCLLISQSKKEVNQIKLSGQNYQLTCLLEEAPETALKGQLYEFQTPILCLLEDAPESSLKGQSYHLATPLMTPFACIVKETWQRYYQKNLKQLGINYWEWKDKPESKNVCEELNLLLELSPPRGYAKQVLESIARNNNPFKTNFAHLNPMLQLRMRLAFQEWNEEAINKFGNKKLKLIYKICYGTNLNMIPKIINISKEVKIKENKIPWWEILGVSPSAKEKEVEIAYKKLIKSWHPDLNSHPEATIITAQINAAYSEYKSLFQGPSFRDTQLNKLNLLLKIFLNIFRPLLSK